jgi:Protein of unknown function (DUF541)
MRIAILACGAAAAGLVLAGVLGAASAETPTPTVAPARVVSVQGVATEPVAQSASAQSATAVYHQAMSEAVADGLTKAQLLAGKATATLGDVQSMTEDGGSIQCAVDAEYEGEMPDFGSPDSAGSGVGFDVSGRAVAPAASAVSGKPTSTHAKHKKHHAAKKSSLASCTLVAEVSLIYPLS